MFVEITAPGGDLGQKLGETVLDGHGSLLWLQGWTRKMQTARPVARMRNAGHVVRNSAPLGPDLWLSPHNAVILLKNVLIPTCCRPKAARYDGKVTRRASGRSSQMATKPSQPQQGGTGGQGQQQQGEQPGSLPQQAGQPIFRDWAAI
jgi:hypothetical protein